MRLLRISIYVLIVLAIAKLTGGNTPRLQEETAYSNNFTFRATPQVEEQSLREVMKNDSVTYLNFYSDYPLNQKPMYIKSNRDSSNMLTRIFQTKELPDRKSDTSFSFIVF